VVDRINSESHNTGITAEVSSYDIVLTTVDYGTDASIAIDVSSGTFNTSGTPQGSDAVVTINGEAVDASRVDGNKVSFLSNGNHVVFDLTAGYTGALSPITISDEQVAKFALSTNLQHTSRMAVPNINSAVLGGVSGAMSDLLSGGSLSGGSLSGGSLSGLGGNTSQALHVVDGALGQLTLTEGSVDAFADVTVASAASLLDGLDEQMTETLNQFNGVNEEEETLLLTRNQSLGGNGIATISLLLQQQSNMLALVRMIAGV
jgi:hypothetical protein